MTIVRSVQLFFQEGSSDKVYHATILDEGDGTYSVEVEWGRRGANLSRGKKAVKVALAKAEAAFAKLVREKTSKGYEEITETSAPAEVAPPLGEGSGSRATGVRAKVGHAAQLLHAIEYEQALTLLEDREHIAQQKLDGNRVLLHIDEDEIRPTNRNGQLTKVDPAVLEGCAWLPAGTVVDGELVDTDEGPIHWLFDVLELAGEDLRELGYLERWQRLDAEVEPALSGPIRVLDYAQGREAKHDLYQRLRAAKSEGIVFKHVGSAYQSGRSASAGAFKHKFVKTADVILTENAGNAYRMAVYAGKKLQDIGKVFSGTTNETRAEIDDLLAGGERPIAEVRYLYATDDEHLYQPVFVRLRGDKSAKECVLGQLEKTGREKV